jgi:hypothetical protein
LVGNLFSAFFTSDESHIVSPFPLFLEFSIASGRQQGTHGQSQALQPGPVHRA